VHVEFSMCQDVAEVESLIEGDDWPFHSGGAAVAWTGPGVQSFWVSVDGERAGVVRLYDLDDGGRF
jgi:hypothetical protein